MDSLWFSNCFICITFYPRSISVCSLAFSPPINDAPGPCQFPLLISRVVRALYVKDMLMVAFKSPPSHLPLTSLDTFFQSRPTDNDNGRYVILPCPALVPLSSHLPLSFCMKEVCEKRK